MNPRTKNRNEANRLRPAAAALRTLALSSRSATESLGRTIGQLLMGGETLALYGELGAGKTALVRGIAMGLGIPANHVTSPTFVLIHEYRGRLPLIHMDLYRLRTIAEAEGIGLHDYFQDGTVTAIEWADKFPELLPDDRLELTLEHRTPTTRTVRLRGIGPRAGALLSALTQQGEHIRLAAEPGATRTAPAPKGRIRTS